MTMTGFEAYKMYLAIKNHFSLDNYDFLRYNGRISASEESFLKRKDKFFFTKLGRRFDAEDMKYFLVSNFFENEKIWVGNLLDEKHLDVYKKWQKKQQSLTYIIKSDFQTILSFIEDNDIKFDELFAIREHELPLLLQLQQEDTIQVETLIVMDRVLNFFKRWDNKIEDEIFYPTVRKRIKKYEGFVDFDTKKAKSLMKENFT
jgi:hypothetical protein